MTREDYKKKSDLVMELFEQKGSRTCSLMIQLCDMMIQDLREENDTADIDRFRINQGNIEAWKAMKTFITEGVRQIPIPNMKK